MALDWSDAAKAQLGGSFVRKAIFLRVQSDPVMRMWAAPGDFEMAADLVETTDGAIYTGVGWLLGIPKVSQLINGLAERVQFTLSGVDDNLVGLASASAASVRGARTSLGFMLLTGPDADVGPWQPASPVAWLWEGTTDVVPIQWSPSGKPRTISLSVGSLFTGRQRPNLSYYTDAEQRRRSPDDSFCDHVATLSAGTTVRFKPRS